jgi:hypothetical protein
LTSLENVGDYNFKLEFSREEEKRRVIEGGLWGHQGDTLIVMHYDGLAHPSEVCIDNRGMWVHFYDLSPAMMKETFAKHQGVQIGKHVKLDTRYP